MPMSKEKMRLWRQQNAERIRAYMAQWWVRKLAEEPDYKERIRAAEAERRRLAESLRAESDPEYAAGLAHRRRLRSDPEYAALCREKKAPLAKTCGVCGGAFLTTRPKHVYCSPACGRRRERERYNAVCRTRRATDPEFAEMRRERDRLRYANNPEYRQYKIDASAERYEGDPEYRASLAAGGRRRRSQERRKIETDRLVAASKKLKERLDVSRDCERVVCPDRL